MGPLSFVLFWNSVQVSVEVSPIRSVFCASLVLSEDWRLIGCSRGACDQSAVGARGLGVTEVPSGGSDDRHLLYSTPDTMDMTSDWYIVFLVCFGSRLIMIRGRLAQSAEALSEHNINGQQIILSVWHSQFVKLCIHVNVIVNCLDVVFLSFRSMQVSQRTHTQLKFTRVRAVVKSCFDGPNESALFSSMYFKAPVSDASYPAIVSRTLLI